ncbi:MAG: type II CAAX endopeptidase family protein [Bacteroidota bacterium]|nr:type II CAAX endopeptidase family protein [Bacteroidota bacterium]
MEKNYANHYPRVLQAINLVVLYIFIQTLFDFPLAIYDYLYDTEFLYYKPYRWFVSFGSTIFILIYGFKQTHHTFKEVFPLKKFNLFLPILIFIFLLGEQYYIDIVNIALSKVLPAPGWFWEMFGKAVDPKGNIWTSLLKVVIIAPIVEESIFRGIIMHGFMRNYSNVKAIVISALMFALFHLNPWQFPSTFVLGLFLGWLMVATRSLLVCILGHAINNFIVLMSIVYMDKLKQIPFFSLTVGTSYIITAFLVFISLMLIVLITSPNLRKGLIWKQNRSVD